MPWAITVSGFANHNIQLILVSLTDIAIASLINAVERRTLSIIAAFSGSWDGISYLVSSEPSRSIRLSATVSRFTLRRVLLDYYVTRDSTTTRGVAGHRKHIESILKHITSTTGLWIASFIPGTLQRAVGIVCRGWELKSYFCAHLCHAALHARRESHQVLVDTISWK